MTVPTVLCREIADHELGRVARFLDRGFPRAAGEGWNFGRVLNVLARRRLQPLLPRFGFMLESDGELVGAVLQMCTHMADGTPPQTRCAMSSWVVTPEFRPYAPLLAARAMRIPGATYLNMTPAAHTVPILEAQGYQPLFHGRMITFPASGRVRERTVIRRFSPSADRSVLPALEWDLMAFHADCGCRCVTCDAGGGTYPFVFMLQSGRGPMRIAHLMYCRHIDDYARFSHPLARHMAPFGIAAVTVSSDAYIGGMRNVRDTGGAIYCKGPHPPRVGDLAYSERVFFGIAPRVSVVRTLLRSALRRHAI